ncbi:hypothetical protein PF005_g32020 [Phytophthora fragariae]|uniref:Reverse transcriptase Ty1/copia-type domain-containing protein n=1 Tax=Phytophthora fragariae TaxID=53985 RepID=A0A6A3GGC4_9STRA|nr:hypothetical protein PF009_g32346 [Phytophthora fragariae]KAE8955790.1 hypothetical protein PF011_g31690 [Phytophthora fragariae]KAE9055082.1 hypothetical protein PF010_g32284 [Phytophthora fragariae]KAE9056669.1 hypothetical protein PF007_g31915 [Phytophthora fragariae]KAE9057965.1 hypothetical protein PF006_g32281 [Phytophthora fragariae]
MNTATAIVAEGDLEAENGDIDTAYLYGDVEAEIYIDQSDGFIVQALYGTMQAVRQWNSKRNQQSRGSKFQAL